MKIEIPGLSLVMLAGTSSSGKTTFAKEHFLSSEVLSSDAFRKMVTDDENDQSANAEVFELLYEVAEKRLSRGLLTVIDSTNVQKSVRKPIIELAKRQNVHCVAIVLNPAETEILTRNRERSDRNIPVRAIRKQRDDLQKSIKGLKKEGFRFVYVLNSREEADNAEIVRTRLWNDLREEQGPFDIIGDVHGCIHELKELLEKLGYIQNETGVYSHPAGRKAAFIGDLCDRGPDSVGVFKLVMGMVSAKTALCVPGNHDEKLLRKLKGKNVQVTHGLEKTLGQLASESAEWQEELKRFLDRLISHYVLDGGKLVIVHAGLKEQYIGRASSRVREFCLYGETNGETDAYGTPVRIDWAAEYRGESTVIYGHTPMTEARRINRTCCIDTGCVFGGKLTAYRYPEGEIVSVDAAKVYYKPVKPLQMNDNPNHGEEYLSIGDIQGKMRIETDLLPAVTIPEENVAAALENMSCYAADPRWLIYLPPTMSPCAISNEEGYLEYPTDAFYYYKKRGVERVICEKKHMGSRAVIVLCKDVDAARSRFRVEDGRRGIIYTRTGRRFFDNRNTEDEVLTRLEKTLSTTGFWEDFETDWVCFDVEIMPWSEKARKLIREQYAPVGRAGIDSTGAAVKMLDALHERNGLISGNDARKSDLGWLLAHFKDKQSELKKYVRAYQTYCWEVNGVDDLRIAPFHLLACENKLFSDKTHVWQMEMIEKYCTGIDDIFIATERMIIDLSDESYFEAGTKWWLSLTENGGEGMVVKPENYVSYRGAELLQPAIKCRGRNYLHIIYGAEYLMEDHLERLKKRSLSRKRKLALQEFSLGLEALNRFVKKEPLYRIHECVFGVLALESEPVDPRL